MTKADTTLLCAEACNNVQCKHMISYSKVRRAEAEGKSVTPVFYNTADLCDEWQPLQGDADD